MATTPDQQTTPPTPFPAWAIWTITICGGLVALLNFVVSTDAILELALQGFKISLARAWGTALSLDFAALVTGTFWVAGWLTHRRDLERFGRNLTIGLVAMSGALNVGELAWTAKLISPEALVVVALVIGVFAPVSTMLMSHLIMQAQSTRAVAEPKLAPVPVSALVMVSNLIAEAQSSAAKPKKKKAPVVVDAAAAEPQPAVDLTKAQPSEPVAAPVPILALAGNDGKVLAAVAQLADRDEGPAGPTDIAKRAGVPLATTKRRLNHLVGVGRVVKHDGLYRPVEQLAAV